MYIFYLFVNYFKTKIFIKKLDALRLRYRLFLAVKRKLRDCIDGYSHLRHNRAAQAIMTHRNTPNQDLRLSPSEILCGRTIRDHLTILREKHRVHDRWPETKQLRQRTMAKRHMLNKEQYNMHSLPLQQLQVGESVQVKSQKRPYPQRWTKMGRVVETMGNRQYRIRLDGSGRITLRNRCLPGRSNLSWICQIIRPMDVEKTNNDVRVAVDTSDVDMEVDNRPD